MKSYKGTHLGYHKPLRIYKGFEARLARFEEIAKDVATEVYGRAPKRIVHIGAYNCRRIRRYPTLLSEHGVGNAVDIRGFDFGRAASKEEREKSPHKRLRGSFQVTVEKHWEGKRGPGAVHSRFLKELTQALQADEVFRVYLGPAYPGHDDHFHFDVAPYELTVL